MRLFVVLGYFLAGIAHAGPKCDYFLANELKQRKVGSLAKLNSEFQSKILADKNSKEYKENGYDTLAVYPEGSDPFGDDGYKETPLSRQILITPINIQAGAFSQIRVFIHMVNSEETIAGYSVVGDKEHSLEDSRVILQDTKTCKVRLAHNHYNSKSLTKTGETRGWVKVDNPICEKLKNNMSRITQAMQHNDGAPFRNSVPEPAVTANDQIALDDTIRLCGFLVPDIKSVKPASQNSGPAKRSR